MSDVTVAGMDIAVSRERKVKTVDLTVGGMDIAISQAYLARFKNAFGYEAILDRPLARSMEERAKKRWTVERTAAVDQIGGASYSKQRRAELTKLAPASYLAKEFGLRTVSGMSQDGVRVDHADTPTYNRDIVSREFKSDLKKLADKVGFSKDLPENRVLFVNSGAAFKRLEQLFPVEDAQASAVQTQSLCPGIVAVKRTDGKPFPEEWKEGIRTIGAMPSVHQLVKLREGGFADDGAVLTGSYNAKNLNALSADTSAAAFLGRVPDDHPMGALAKTTSKLIAGLKDIIDPGTDKQEKNVLIGNAIANLEGVLAVMPAYLEDTQTFTRLYEVMIDEIYLILASVKPYTTELYAQKSSDALDKRAPSLKGTPKQSYLLSSGMDALTTSLGAAFGATGTDRPDHVSGTGRTPSRTPDYFELAGVLKDGHAHDAGSGLIVSTLNPSRPTTDGPEDETHRWGAKEVVASVTKKITDGLRETPGRKFVLVLDITVERGGPDGASDLEEVTKGLKTHVDTGTLSLMLCKSYQKYAALGSSKVMSGGVTVISNDKAIGDKLNDSLTKAQADLDPMKADEAQLITHFIDAGDGQELATMKRASDNAAFVQSFCTTGGWGKREQGLPFIVARDTKKFTDNSLPTGAILGAIGMDQRDSFGFLTTTFLDAGADDDDTPFVRITFGQESRQEIVEKSFAIGKIPDDVTKSQMPGWAMREVGQATATAATAVWKNADPSVYGPAVLSVMDKGKHPGAGDFRVALKSLSDLRSARQSLPKESEDGPEADRKIVEKAKEVREAAEAFWVSVSKRPGGGLTETMDLVASTTTRAVEISADGFEDRLPALTERLGTFEKQFGANDELAGLYAEIGGEIAKGDAADGKALLTKVALLETKLKAATASALTAKTEGRKFTPSDREQPAFPSLPKHLQASHEIERLSSGRKPRSWRSNGGPSSAQDMDAAQYLPNIAASCLTLPMAVADKMQDPLDPALAAVVAKLLSGDMDAISPRARERLVMLWTADASRKLARKLNQNEEDKNVVAAETVDTLLAGVDQVPFPESRAKLLEALPDDMFGKLPQDQRTKLVSGLFGAQDIDLQIATLTTLIGKLASNKLRACFASIEAALAAAKSVPIEKPDASGGFGRPERRRVTLGDAEIADYQEQIAGRRHKLVETALGKFFQESRKIDSYLSFKKVTDEYGDLFFTNAGERQALVVYFTGIERLAADIQALRPPKKRLVLKPSDPDADKRVAIIQRLSAITQNEALVFDDKVAGILIKAAANLMPFLTEKAKVVA
jgi:hypothetical protein